MENEIIFNLINEKLDLGILGHWSYLVSLSLVSRKPSEKHGK